MTAMVIAFASAKGGAGKTVTAASLAVVLAAIGRRVLLIDTDAATNGLTLFYLDEVVAAKSDRTDDWVRVWDVENAQSLRAFLSDPTGAVNAVALGRVRNRDAIVTGSVDAVRIWDADRGELQEVLLGTSGGVNAVAVGRIGEDEAIVFGSGDVVGIWDLRNARQARHLTGHGGTVNALAVGRVGERDAIVSGGHDGTVRLWDADSGEPLRLLTGHSAPIRSVALGRIVDGDVIVSGSDDHTVRIWDAGSGEPRGVIRGTAGAVNAVALGRIGEREVIVSGSDDRTVRIWDAASGEPRGVLYGAAGAVNAVALGRIGEREVIVSGSDDRTVRIWDADGGQPLSVLTGHSGPVRAVALGRIGEREVVVAGSNKNKPLAGIFDAFADIPRPMVIQERLDLIPATYVMRQTEGVDPMSFEAALKTTLTTYQSQYDFIILDAQAGSDVYALAAVGKADRAVIVSEYDPVSAAGVERLRHVDPTVFSYDRTWILLSKVLPEFARAVGSFLEVARYLPPVPWDADVIRAFARRELAVDPEQPNSYTLAIAEVARTLAGRAIQRDLSAWRVRTGEATTAPFRFRLDAVEEELLATERELVHAQVQLERQALTSWLGRIVVLGGAAMALFGAAVLALWVTGSQLLGSSPTTLAGIVGLLAGGLVVAGGVIILQPLQRGKRSEVQAKLLAMQRRRDELRDTGAKYRTMIDTNQYLAEPLSPPEASQTSRDRR